MDIPQLPTLDAAVHLIQIALTPVFLLSGIAALLNVFAGRLAKVADRLDQLTAELRTASTDRAQQIAGEIDTLHKRSIVLDTAVILGAVGAVATCLSIVTLFLFALSNSAVAGILLFFFGLAILCTLGSVAAFGFEMLVSSKGLRTRMRLHLPRLAFGPFAGE